MPVVVLAKMKAGQIEDWKRLDEVWALVGDKPAFAKYVRDAIKRCIAGDKQPTPVASTIGRPAIPVPDATDFRSAAPKAIAGYSGSKVETLFFVIVVKETE